MTLRNPDAARRMWTVVLLVISFVLSVFLAVRAHVAAQYHRATAQSVLRDYAQLVADEFVRRAANQIGYFGASPILEFLASTDGAPLPAELPKNGTLARRTFRLVQGQPRASVSAGTPPEIAARLAVELAPRFARDDGRDVLVAHMAGARRTFLYAVRDRVIAGFELEEDALRPLMAAAFERPLLPPSLSKERVGNRDLYLRVIDQRNVEIFYSGAVGSADYTNAFDHELGVRREISDDTYPVMRGMRIETSIHRDVADDLIIGGLPRSPTRLYLGIVLVSGALLAVALLQLRREHALARLRSDFVSSVSHELRTPLTQIRMFAETLLLDRVRSDEERRRSLKVIDQEARRLTSLVENVLSFSRRERGTLDIDRRAADVSALVASAVEAFTPIAAARQMEIVLDARAPVVALVDDDAIRQVVINLLDNAVKYGPEGQRIAVSVQRVKDAVTITVEDEGPGVPPRDRERIFDRYVRLNRDTAGAGIGLTVVREIVALHGGRVRVEDGSRFVVTLPVAGERGA